jgi:hypothetical protein
LAWPEGTFKWFNHQLNSNTNSAIWKQEKQPTTTSNSHTKFAQLLLMRNKQKHYYNTTKELKTLAPSNLQYKHPEGYCQFTLNSSYLLLLEVLTFFLVEAEVHERGIPVENLSYLQCHGLFFALIKRANYFTHHQHQS